MKKCRTCETLVNWSSCDAGCNFTWSARLYGLHNKKGGKLWCPRCVAAYDKDDKDYIREEVTQAYEKVKELCCKGCQDSASPPEFPARPVTMRQHIVEMICRQCSGPATCTPCPRGCDKAWRFRARGWWVQWLGQCGLVMAWLYPVLIAWLISRINGLARIPFY